MKTFKGRVTMYAPEKMYGFAKDPKGPEEVFFHLGEFRWLGTSGTPPPVVGEWVECEYDPTKPKRGSAVRARRVSRMSQPPEVEGVVLTFDSQRGYGFIKADDGTEYYLHRSEVEDNILPVVGERVRFYGGFKKGKPRACYIRRMP